MTVLTLTALWINRLDTTEAVSAQSSRERSQAHSIDMSVRTYSSGRRRAISVAGVHGELSWQLVSVPLATVTKLYGWQGIAVQVRDHRGQKFFGVFGGISVVEYMDTTLYSVGFTLQTITYVEGV